VGDRRSTGKFVNQFEISQYAIEHADPPDLHIHHAGIWISLKDNSMLCPSCHLGLCKVNAARCIEPVSHRWPPRCKMLFTEIEKKVKER